MADRYKIDLESFNVTKVNAVYEHPASGGHTYSADYKMTVKSPNDPKDPTVLLKVDADVTCETSGFKAYYSADSILRFDPIPDNWDKAVMDNCRDLIQNLMMNFIKNLLGAMGYSVEID